MDLHPKKSIFGAIKEAFVEEVPEAKHPPVFSSTPAPSTNPFTTPFSAVRTDPDPAALAKLEATVKNSAPPAYSSFIDQFEALAEVLPDVSTRTKAALKASKVSATVVKGAVDTLIQELDHAASEFDKTFGEQKSKLESQHADSLKSTEDLIKSKEDLLKSIQDQIASAKVKLEADTQHLTEETHRLEGIRTGFVAAHKQVVDRLTTQREMVASTAKG